MQLSSAQKSLMANIMHDRFVPYDGHSSRVAKCLVKKGLLEADPYRVDVFLITDKGEAMQRELRKCEVCNHETHPLEAACLGCGRLAKWAEADHD